MRENDYYRFLIRLEAGPHLSIPKFVMGDFSLFTSPNGKLPVFVQRSRYHFLRKSTDPIFFLHHAQLDKLWWQWEQYDLSERQSAYSGSYKAKSKEQASPNDVISIGALAPDIKGKDVLDIQSGLLCYRY